MYKGEIGDSSNNKCYKCLTNNCKSCSLNSLEKCIEC